MAELEDFPGARWEEKVEQAATALATSLAAHASGMQNWIPGDNEELQLLNSILRNAVQEYENVLSDKTGALLDLGLIKDAEDQGGADDNSPQASPGPQRVSVISRFEYRLDGDEDLSNFSVAGREYLAGLQVAFIPDQPISVDDPLDWPPDNFEAMLHVDGLVFKEDVFDPMLDEPYGQ